MRFIAFVLAALFISGPAAAQQWKEYAYIVEGFAVSFPNEPQVEDVEMYQIIPGKNVPAHIYSSSFNGGTFKVTVADARDGNLQEGPVLDNAVNKLTQGGTKKIDFPHRIYRIYGRQFSVERPNGGLTTAAVFFANERLYVIESTRPRGGNDSDLIKFQQSLVFDRNVANRSRQQMEAIRASCVGINANPAGLDDPRCTRK